MINRKKKRDNCGILNTKIKNKKMEMVDRFERLRIIVKTLKFGGARKNQRISISAAVAKLKILFSNHQE